VTKEINRGDDAIAQVIRGTRVRKRYVHVSRTARFIGRIRAVRKRTTGALLSVVVIVPVIPMLVRSSPAVAAHEFVAGDRLLTPELRIVDFSTENAERLAKPFRDSGMPVLTFSPDVLRSIGSEPAGSVWWITARVAAEASPSMVAELISRGDRLLLDGDTTLSRKLLGLTKAPSRTPPSLALVHRGVNVRWDKPVAALVPTVAGRAIATTDRNTPALYLTQTTQVLWSLADLSNGLGPSRLPFLGQELATLWNLRPRASSSGFDIYVDLDNEKNRTNKWLVDHWAAAGVKRIFLPAWKYDEKTKDMFAYKSLIAAVHKRKIEVWAWLEWPHVAFKFWDVHPECRERSADGRVARIGSRELVALTDSACFDLAWSTSKRVLTEFKFDGVNVSNLQFESLYFGHRDARYYTPFHPTVRAEFTKKYKWDPVEIVRIGTAGKPDPAKLKQWQEYREDALVAIYDKLLTRLATLKQGRRVSISLIDDRSLTPESTLVRENSGLSSTKILKLQPKFGFSIVVRDPIPFRAVRPRDIASGFRASLNKGPNSKITLGVSNVARTKASGARTDRPVGFELSTSVSDAVQTGSPVALFGSGRMRTDDLSWVKYSLATRSSVLETGGTVHTFSPNPFRLRLAKSARHILIDGHRAGSGHSVMVPAGTHRVTVAP
jgi:hypothetical protein